MKIKAINAQNYLNHLQVLAYLAGGIDLYEAGKLFEKLCRIEKKENRIACDDCNGVLQWSEEKEQERAEKSLNTIKSLLPVCTSVFLNGDPRGYTLKIKESEVKTLQERGFNIYTDWGGYGILAPEF